MILLSLLYTPLDENNLPTIHNDLVAQRENILLEESAFIGEFLAREIRRKIKWGCGRLNFTCISQGTPRERMCDGFGYCELDVPFDNKYFDMSNEEKMVYLCNIYRYGLKEFCERKNLDFSIIDAAITKLQENNYFVDFYIFKPCRRGEYTAKLYCIVDINNSNFYVDLFHKRKLINRIPIFKTSAYHLGFYYAYSSLEWIDDNTIRYAYMNDKETKVLKVK